VAAAEGWAWAGASKQELLNGGRIFGLAEKDQLQLLGMAMTMVNPG
jgi:hypothetical protein